MIENRKLKMSVKKEGYISELAIKYDPYKMNWVIEDIWQADIHRDLRTMTGFMKKTDLYWNPVKQKHGSM